MAQESKKLKLGINGFGRIGRMVVRIAMSRSDVEIVGINDPFIPADYMVYQFKYDSSQGKWNGTVKTDGENLIIDGHKIKVFAERNPDEIDWKGVGASYVAECTGVFTGVEAAGKHLKGGAKRVIVSAPSKDAPMFCCGVNTDEIDLKEEVISNASCTTNCLAPVAKILNDNWGIETGLMTTVHATTATQKTVDGIVKNQKKRRSGRGAIQNIIPASTGAAIAIGKVIKALDGKLNGMAFRVPIACGSVVDLVCTLKNSTTMDEIRKKMKEASEGEMKGILGYTDEDIVSSDILGETCSSIFDSKASMMMGDKMVKIITWYDNEWGYSTRLLDLCVFVAKKDGLCKL